jgi:hypothetical protein
MLRTTERLGRGLVEGDALVVDCGRHNPLRLVNRLTWLEIAVAGMGRSAGHSECVTDPSNIVAGGGDFERRFADS